MSISERVYLIVHAPEKPQRWFIPKMVEEAPNYADNSIVPENADERTKHFQAVKDWQKWSNEYEKQVCIQWPAAWADAVLAGHPDQAEAAILKPLSVMTWPIIIAGIFSLVLAIVFIYVIWSLLK